MKTLSVRQPWAFAILHLGKDIENRSWPTDYRGPLAIHASKRIDREAVSDLERWFEININDHELVTGAIVGTVDLVDCLPPESPGDESIGEWGEPGQYHWLLSNPARSIGPFPASANSASSRSRSRKERPMAKCRDNVRDLFLDGDNPPDDRAKLPGRAW
jgi:hypothetical protein